MAAYSKGRSVAGSIGKRFVDQIWAARAPAPLPAVSSPAPAASSFGCRPVHVSAYDKNVDEQVRPTVVPDHVIDSGAKTTKYWEPHPTTGVFGPADEAGSAAAAAGAGKPPVADGKAASVLDQPAWFRPLEDVDKAPYA